MKRLSALLALFLGACTPASEHAFEAGQNKAHVLPLQEMSIGAEASISIDVGSMASTIKELESTIHLLAKPSDEVIGPEHWPKGEAYSLKSIEKGRIYSLTPKKKLKEGERYGLYFRLEGEDKARLAQVFMVKYQALRLIKHDIGQGSLPAVPKNRRVFTFNFDQPVQALGDDAVKLKGNEQALALESISIPFNESQIRVAIAPDQLRVGEEYALSFGAIFNNDKTPGDIKPIRFRVSDAKAALSEQSPLSIAVGHDSAEISWHLDQDHLSELFYGMDTGLHDCLSTACPKTSRALFSVGAEDTVSSLSRFYLTKLAANTAYHLVLRTMDLQGQVLLGAASFKTQSGPSIRFSEILIDPKVQRGVREYKSEFIELYNASEKSLLIQDLSLQFESVDGGSRRACVLANPTKPLALSPKAYFLVVGQEFDASLWNLPAESLVIRLPKKNICGGLPNERAFIIKIMGEKGALLDRFGASLWQGQEGSSIARHDVLLADEPQNYCFSATDAGPSPGLKNEKFGPCGVP